MKKKGPTAVGTKVGKGREWPYLCGILFNSFPNVPPLILSPQQEAKQGFPDKKMFSPPLCDSRVLKMIYNTKRNWDKQA